MSVFLSTPSARRATQGLEQYNRHNQNFYPRPLRGGRRENGDVAHHTVVISIHALCEEGDGRMGKKSGHLSDFYPRPLRGGRQVAFCHLVFSFGISIHALCEEGDGFDTADAETSVEFLSTPSARRATLQCLVTWSSHRYFYPRPLRGGRRNAGMCLAGSCGFLSTPSARRATSHKLTADLAQQISIHALCEEGDIMAVRSAARL